MASIFARLINSLRDIRIPFPMTQAPTAPGFTAIADPATGTVDIGGIIYQLESLHSAYQATLDQAIAQVQSIELPARVVTNLVNQAREAARQQISREAGEGVLMNDDIRTQVRDYVDARLDRSEELIKAIVADRCDDQVRVAVRDLVATEINSRRDSLLEHVATHQRLFLRTMEEHAQKIRQELTAEWGARFATLATERDVLKQALCLLTQDGMRAMAREVLAEAVAAEQQGPPQEPTPTPFPSMPPF